MNNSHGHNAGLIVMMCSQPRYPQCFCPAALLTVDTVNIVNILIPPILIPPIRVICIVLLHIPLSTDTFNFTAYPVYVTNKLLES